MVRSKDLETRDVTSKQVNSMLLERFSSFDKLLRITAWCLRWIEWISNKCLSNTEVKIALKVLIQLVLKEEFGMEIQALKKSIGINEKFNL